MMELEVKKEKKLTKKEQEKRDKIFEFLSKCWERLEKDDPRYLESINIGDWKSPEYSAWSYKLDEDQKAEGIKELNVWVGFEPKAEGKKDYDLKLMSEEEDKTIQEYLLIYRSGRLSSLESEMGGYALYNRIYRARQEYLKDLAEEKEQEDLKTMGYEAYVDKKIVEDNRLKGKENDNEEEKRERQYHRQLTKKILMEYQWNVGGWAKGIHDKLDNLKKEAEEQGKKFYDWMINNVINEIVRRNWDIHSKSIYETVHKLHGSDRYRDLTIRYRDGKVSNYYAELGADIQKDHPNYSIKDLGEHYGKQFLKEEINSIVEAEYKERESWNEQQWKNYYPRESYGDYEEIRVEKLNNYHLNRFFEEFDYTWKSFSEQNKDKYPNSEDTEGLYREWKKEIATKVKIVIDNILKGLNFTYTCEWCSKETKNNPQYKLVAKTKHNMIYTCQRCENSEYYLSIRELEKENENKQQA
jgi:hypothetical protein